MVDPAVPDEIVERYATKTRCTRHDAASKTCAYAHGAPCQCRCDVESAAETLGMVSAAALAVLREEAVAVPVQTLTELECSAQRVADKYGADKDWTEWQNLRDELTDLAASPYAQAQETQHGG